VAHRAPERAKDGLFCADRTNLYVAELGQVECRWGRVVGECGCSHLSLQRGQVGQAKLRFALAVEDEVGGYASGEADRKIAAYSQVLLDDDTVADEAEAEALGDRIEGHVEAELIDGEPADAKG